MSGKIRELTNIIKRSEEYRRYQRIRIELDQQTELKHQVDAYRIEKYRMQQFGADMFAAADELHARYRYLFDNPLVMEYLELENAICKMIRETCNEIVEEIPLDLPDIG
ncbi:MAG: YlbF family regulator [Eubacterium sp.]|nr:YlbF family regulator [Eubacterium sp.]